MLLLNCLSSCSVYLYHYLSLFICTSKVIYTSKHLYICNFYLYINILVFHFSYIYIYLVSLNIFLFTCILLPKISCMISRNLYLNACTLILAKTRNSITDKKVEAERGNSLNQFS